MGLPALSFDGGRVLPFAEAHLTARYVGWLNDPEVVRFSEQRHRQHTLASCRQYFESFHGTVNEFLAIESSDPTLGHVGNIAIAVDAANQVGDVSIVVGERKAWGSGLGTRAWCRVVDELAARRQLRKITAGTMATNMRMLKLMARSGMAEEGRRSRHFLWEGAEVDLIMAARFPSPADTR